MYSRPVARTKSQKAKPKPKPKPPGRYTAPAPKKAAGSKLGCRRRCSPMLALGMVVIIANYLQLLPGGEARRTRSVSSAWGCSWAGRSSRPSCGKGTNPLRVISHKLVHRLWRTVQAGSITRTMSSRQWRGVTMIARRRRHHQRGADTGSGIRVNQAEVSRVRLRFGTILNFRSSAAPMT